LILTPKTEAKTEAPPPLTDCFDGRSHLLALQRGVRAGPQGTTPFVARIRDWRPVGDMKVAFVTEMQVGPLSFIGTVTSVELDTPIDPTMFAMPAASAAPATGGGGDDATGAADGGKSAAKARGGMSGSRDATKDGKNAKASKSGKAAKAPTSTKKEAAEKTAPPPAGSPPATLPTSPAR